MSCEDWYLLHGRSNIFMKIVPTPLFIYYSFLNRFPVKITKLSLKQLTNFVKKSKILNLNDSMIMYIISFGQFDHKIINSTRLKMSLNNLISVQKLIHRSQTIKLLIESLGIKYPSLLAPLQTLG